MARLTSVVNVKRFLAVPTANQDALIDQLIARESALIERWTGRNFSAVVTQANARLNGTGTDTIVLHDQPVIAVTALAIGGVTANYSLDGLTGDFVYDDTSVSLINGYTFPQGRQNVIASWTAGYRNAANYVVPTGNAPVQISPDELGFATVDRGVAYAANGAAFVLTTAANGPLVGQYSFGLGVYTFNVADSSQTVTLTYDYAPADVEQACIEMVGLDLKQRDNLGVSSKSLAGESITYEKKGISISAKEMLQSYRRVAPA